MAKYSYDVVFRIRHSSLDPREVTNTLKMKPHRLWKAGERRTVPSGRVLNTRNRDSFWSYREIYTGPSRAFFKRTARLVNRLKRHKAFLREITKGGGQCELYILLSGAVNIGDSIPPEMLGSLADLRIWLSVEIFPKARSVDS